MFIKIKPLSIDRQIDVYMEILINDKVDRQIATQTKREIIYTKIDKCIGG